MASYIMADVQTGWVAGFDADGEPIFESKPALKHHTVSQGEWLFNIAVVAAKCGIGRIEFVHGGQVVKEKTLAELVAEIKAVA
jgi:hypothetical protein